MTRLMWGILAVIVNLAAAGLLNADGVAPDPSTRAAHGRAFPEAPADLPADGDPRRGDTVYAVIATPAETPAEAGATQPRDEAPRVSDLCAMQSPALDGATSSQCSTCPLSF